ncbi:hypothetical protein Tco_0524739 [Tanacetum coccineum]
MPSPFKESTSKLDNSVVGPGFVLRGPLENPTNDAVTLRLNCNSRVCPEELLRPPDDCNVNASLSFTLQICRVEDILVEGLIQGMGRTGGVSKGHLLSNGIGSGGGYGGTAGHGCYNDTCIEGDLPYGDAELPCQLGSGGGNDSTAGGGVLGVC